MLPPDSTATTRLRPANSAPTAPAALSIRLARINVPAFRACSGSATMPPLVRMGMLTPVGKGFLKRYAFEEAYFRPKSLEFRKQLAMPLMYLGGVNSRATMQQAMADGFDFVVMGRALLREPDLVNRLASGASTEGICIHCNRCMPSIYSGTRCVLDHPEPLTLTRRPA